MTSQAQTLERTWRTLLRTEHQLHLHRREIRRELSHTPQQHSAFSPVQRAQHLKGTYSWMRRKDRTTVRLPVLKFKGKVSFLGLEKDRHRRTNGKKMLSIEETGYEAALLWAYTHKDTGSLSPIVPRWSRMKGNRTFTSPLADADDEDCCVVEVGRTQAAVHLREVRR